MPKTADVHAEDALSGKILYRGHCPACAEAIVPRTAREHLLASRVSALVAAVQWALGCDRSGFAPRKDGEGAYWWRRELQSRARVTPQVTHVWEQSVRVLTAAIKTEDGIIFSVDRPGRHSQVVRKMVDAGLKKPVTKNAVQGFLITGGAFVDRLVAAKLAYAAGQVLPGVQLRASGLYSEDVW